MLCSSARIAYIWAQVKPCEIIQYSVGQSKSFERNRFERNSLFFFYFSGIFRFFKIISCNDCKKIRKKSSLCVSLYYSVFMESVSETRESFSDREKKLGES